MIRDRVVGHVAVPISATSAAAQARVLLRYDGVGNTIDASYNVSSVTDNATGDFTVVPLSVIQLGGFSLASGAVFIAGSSTDGNYISAKASGLGTSVNFIVQSDASTNADVVDNTLIIFDGGVGQGNAR